MDLFRLTRYLGFNRQPKDIRRSEPGVIADRVKLRRAEGEVDPPRVVLEECHVLHHGQNWHLQRRIYIFLCISMYIYVYLFICIYIHIYVYIYIHIYTYYIHYIHIFMPVSSLKNAMFSTIARIGTCNGGGKCIYVCIYVYICTLYVYMYIYKYMCIYI